MLTEQKIDIAGHRRLQVNKIIKTPRSTDGEILISFAGSAFAMRVNSSWLKEHGLETIDIGCDIYVKGEFGNTDGDLIMSKQVKVLKK